MTTEASVTEGMVTADQFCPAGRWPRLWLINRKGHRKRMLAEFGRGDDGSQDEWEANAKFVEIAWNALTSLCPDDPFVAAEAIGEAFEILRRVTEPADNAALCHNIALARALLAKLSKGKP